MGGTQALSIILDACRTKKKDAAYDNFSYSSNAMPELCSFPIKRRGKTCYEGGSTVLLI